MSAIVVTGAAGNLGRRVVTALAQQPDVDRIFAIDRSAVPKTAPVVEAHTFDLAKPGAAQELAALAKGADAVVHLAWQPDGEGNLDALASVLDATEAIEASQFALLSSATVYGAWPDNPVPMSEEAPLRPNPEVAYAVEKREAESLLEEWSHTHPHVAVVVLRPACTVGSTEHPFYEALAGARKPPLGGHSRTVQYLHIDDLVSAVVHTWRHGLEGAYNVSPDSGVDERMAGSLAGGPSAMPLPPKVHDRWSEWRWKLRHRGTQPDIGAYGEQSWVVAADKLRSTGWEPGYTSEEALVVSDKRGHWDEVPTVRKVALVAGGAAAVVAGAGGFALARRRR